MHFVTAFKLDCVFLLGFLVLCVWEEIRDRRKARELEQLKPKTYRVQVEDVNGWARSVQDDLLAGGWREAHPGSGVFTSPDGKSTARFSKPWLSGLIVHDK